MLDSPCTPLPPLLEVRHFHTFQGPNICRAQKFHFSETLVLPSVPTWSVLTCSPLSLPRLLSLPQTFSSQRPPGLLCCSESAPGGRNLKACPVFPSAGADGQLSLLRPARVSVGYAGTEPSPSPWPNSMLAPCEPRECPQGLGSSYIKPTMEVSPGDLEQDCSHRVVINTVWELKKTEAARKSHLSEINTH